MPSSKKDACPLCGEPKTPWSLKCQQCQGERVKLQTALERHESDLDFLNTHEGQTLAQIGRTLGVSRERARQLLAKAHRRLDYLSSHTTAAGSTTLSVM